MCLRKKFCKFTARAFFVLWHVTSCPAERIAFMANVSCQCEIIALLQTNYRQHLISMIVCKDPVAKAV